MSHYHFAEHKFVMHCRGRELTEKILFAQLALFPAFYGTEWLIIAIISSYLEPNVYRWPIYVFVTYLSHNYFNNIKTDKR